MSRAPHTAASLGIVGLFASLLLVQACDRSTDLIAGHLHSATSVAGGGSTALTPEGGSGGQPVGVTGGADAGMQGGAAGTAQGGAPTADAGNATSSMRPCGTGTAPCPADEYCSFAGVPACGSGALGHCTQRPPACPTDCLSPMPCACNGQRYCNDCVAQADGFDVGPDNVCQIRHCGSWLGISCSDSEFCDFPDILCGAGKFGNCLVRSNISVCPTTCDPTCACDGLSYCTECEANVAGFDRAPACP
ncbi:MAG TPA: hypothetical protein VL137_02705 [Polyangiaceae bacterium]|nr:hypothetical protein [Polyangiaceae bacterium]